MPEQSFGALVTSKLGNAPKVDEAAMASITPAAKNEDSRANWLSQYAQEEEEEQLTPLEKQRRDLVETVAWKKLSNEQTHTITEDEMEALFDVMDINKDGSVSEDEVLAAFRNVAGTSDQTAHIIELLEEILKTTDFADDQPIDMEDLRQALRLGCEDHAKAMTLKLQGHDPAQGHWIWRDKLLEYLVTRKEMYENCKSLPVTLVFFILFFYLASSHLRTKELNILNNSVGGSFSLYGKSLDMDKMANFFPDSAKDFVSDQVRTTNLANYNQLLGGFRVSKMLPDTEADGPLCSYQLGDYLAERFSGKSHSMEPEICEPGWGNQSSWLLWALNNEDAFSFLQTEKGNNGWPFFASKPAVEGVNIDAVTYNSKMSMYTVVHMSINILPSGYVKAKQDIESIVAHPAWLSISEDLKDEEKRTMMFVGVIFIIMFVLVALGETLEYLQLICSYGFIRGTSKYIDFWNFIDWMNIWMVAVIMINYFYCVHVTSGLNFLVSSTTQLDQNVEYTLGGLEYALNTTAIDYTGQLNQIVHQGDRLVSAYFDLKYYISIFAFFSALRFFKAFRANPRLNCVTQTLVRSFPDLAHFMLVFLALLLAFVLIGHLLFGSRLEDFSTPGKAVNTCFLFLLCYAFDPLAPEMYEHGGVLGTIWAWAFNIGMVLLLLNMVLAIVFDVYTEVKSGVGDAPSLYQQTMEVIDEVTSAAAKRKQMLADVAEQVSKVEGGEAFYEKEGIKRSKESPMDGDWKQQGTEEKCATIYGADMFWASGEPVQLTLASNGTSAAFTNAGGGLVHFKLNTEDPERPIIVFDQGDIWEKCEEPEDPSSKSKKKSKKPKSLKQKSDWSENDLLYAFDVHNAHPGEIVSGQSLGKELECTLIQEKQLQQIIDAAIEASPEDAMTQEVSLADSIRLVCRIDANIRSAVRMCQEPKEELSKEEEKDIRDAEERMKQIEMALGTINTQLDRILTTKTIPSKPMKM
eukprot:gnl/MRDRNA2_/MRDRNA2_87758_c0_seq1.p1 gnl/MRDRNA2_/MRDRNA2_87758_c0~~gnl/MRDRNA2_/MRDRNA2_87758_c0_seq1.p1  ORF type:complete len:973 (+),score=197.50 gnl/MRDRNA2_/MRDRNA2_87758_c0_seq1:148-3066(+)